MSDPEQPPEIDPETPPGRRNRADDLAAMERNQATPARGLKIGRNEPCWCGSGKKYKRCHLKEDEQASRG